MSIQPKVLTRIHGNTDEVVGRLQDQLLAILNPFMRAVVEESTILDRYKSVPVSATAPGRAGDYAADASYFYVCVATNTWRRVAVSTF